MFQLRPSNCCFIPITIFTPSQLSCYSCKMMVGSNNLKKCPNLITLAVTNLVTLARTKVVTLSSTNLVTLAGTNLITLAGTNLVKLASTNLITLVGTNLVYWLAPIWSHWLASIWSHWHEPSWSHWLAQKVTAPHLLFKNQILDCNFKRNAKGTKAFWQTKDIILCIVI